MAFIILIIFFGWEEIFFIIYTALKNRLLPLSQNPDLTRVYLSISSALLKSRAVKLKVRFETPLLRFSRLSFIVLQELKFTKCSFVLKFGGVLFQLQENGWSKGQRSVRGGASRLRGRGWESPRLRQRQGRHRGGEEVSFRANLKFEFLFGWTRAILDCL